MSLKETGRIYTSQLSQ